MEGGQTTAASHEFESSFPRNRAHVHPRIWMAARTRTQSTSTDDPVSPQAFGRLWFANIHRTTPKNPMIPRRRTITVATHLSQRQQQPKAVLRAVMFAVAAAVGSASSAQPIHAQISFGTEPTQPIALSISGGISLGNYQAGVNYGLLELFRRAGLEKPFRDATHIPRYRLATVTGASAGNINTVLWMLEACTKTSSDGVTYNRQEPESSLFWQFWEASGWNQLFVPKSKEPGLLSRDGLLRDISRKIKERMKDTLRLAKNCRVPAGITLTRLRPQQISVEGIPIETQRQATIFEITVNENGQAFFSDPLNGSQAQALLARGQDPAFGSLVQLAVASGSNGIPEDSLLNAVKASSSFPLAFSPVVLSVYNKGDSVSRDLNVNNKDTTVARALYLDGGVFDNNPLGLARTIFRTLQVASAETTLPVIYVNPGRTRSGSIKVKDDTTKADGGVAALLNFLPGAILTARQYELQLLARERRNATALAAGRDLDDVSLVFSSRNFAVFGNHLHAFAGFLSRPARQYDFYVGLYDAFHTVAREYACKLQPNDPDCVKTKLAALLSDPALLGEPARTVTSWLFSEEFAVPAPWASRACHAGKGGTTTDVVTSRTDSVLVVQCAFFKALGVRNDGAADVQCNDQRVVSQILCGDRLSPVLEKLAADTLSVSILRKWQETEACKQARSAPDSSADSASKSSQDDASQCQVEDVFMNLIGNSLSGATTIVDQLLDRMVFVEKLQKRRGQQDHSTVAVAARWIYNATYLRSRPLLDPAPGAVPRSSRARFIPISSIGANLGSEGSDVRFEPTWNLRNPKFANLSFIYPMTGVPAGRSGGSCRAEWCGAGIGLGGGVYFNSLAVNRVGVQFNVVRMPPRSQDQVAWSKEVEVRLVGLAGQVFIAPRFCFADSPRCGGFRDAGARRKQWPTFSIGLADPIGLFNFATDLFR